MDEAAGDEAETVLVEPGSDVAEEESSAVSTADSVCQSTNKNLVCQTTSKEDEEVTIATSAPAGTIKPIDRGVVHQICSGQVCSDFLVVAILLSPVIVSGGSHPGNCRQGTA